MRQGFIVCNVLVHGNVQPVFQGDEGLMFFPVKAYAYLEIRDCIDSVSEAIKRGDMDKDSRMKRSDYIILPATLHSTIECVYNGVPHIMDRDADDWMEGQVKEFPNGFKSWQETHYEVAAFIDANSGHTGDNEICAMRVQLGTKALVDLAENWTDEFENKFKGTAWGAELEYYDEIESFLDSKIKQP